VTPDTEPIPADVRARIAELERRVRELCIIPRMRAGVASAQSGDSRAVPRNPVERTP